MLWVGLYGNGKRVLGLREVCGYRRILGNHTALWDSRPRIERIGKLNRGGGRGRGYIIGRVGVSVGYRKDVIGGRYGIVKRNRYESRIHGTPIGVVGLYRCPNIELRFEIRRKGHIARDFRMFWGFGYSLPMVEQESTIGRGYTIRRRYLWRNRFYRTIIIIPNRQSILNLHRLYRNGTHRGVCGLERDRI